MTLLLNRELVSRAKLYLLSVFPDIVKDCHKMRNLPKTLLGTFENVGPETKLDQITAEPASRDGECSTTATRWRCVLP